MSRSSWLTFVLVGLAPPLVLSGNVLGNSITLAALFPAVAAMLVIASDDEPRPLPEHAVKRLLVAVGVVVVLVGARLARSGLDSLPYKALVIGVPAVLAAWVLSGVYAPSPGCVAGCAPWPPPRHGGSTSWRSSPGRWRRRCPSGSAPSSPASP